MLRLLVVALALANISYFLWTQGALALFGLGPVSQSEAFRLNQQLRPEAMRLLTDTAQASTSALASLPTLPDRTAALAAGSAAPAALAASSSAEPTRAAASALQPASAAVLRSPAASAAAAAPQAPAPFASSSSSSSAAATVAVAALPDECLQAGVFTNAQASALRASLQASLPDGSWALNPAVEPARWIIYMGRYADEGRVAKKRNELRARGVRFEAVQNPSLNPGLSLGHFTSKSDADRELAKDAERGVRTARVIQERGEVRGQRLVLPAANAAVKAQMVAVKPQLAGKTLAVCS